MRGRQIFLAHVSQSGSSLVRGLKFFSKTKLLPEGSHSNISVGLRLKGQRNPSYIVES